MKTLSNFLKDKNGNLSSTRLLMLVCLILLIIDWMFTLLSHGIYNLSWQKVALLTSVFSLKAAQNYKE